jgi:hypothetical protein
MMALRKPITAPGAAPRLGARRAAIVPRATGPAARVAFTLPRKLDFGLELAVVGGAETLGEPAGRTRAGARMQSAIRAAGSAPSRRRRGRGRPRRGPRRPSARINRAARIERARRGPRNSRRRPAET